MCSPKILLLVFILFVVIFCTATHFHLAGRKYFPFSHRCCEIFMFFSKEIGLLRFSSLAPALSLLST